MSGESSKRFGARYGSRIRKNVDEAEKKDSDRYERIAAGIWRDKETGEKIAGGAYKTETGATQIMKKALQKDLEVEELEEAKEELEEE